MIRRLLPRRPGVVGVVLGGALVVALTLPLLALALSSSFADIRFGLNHASFAPAVWLSLRTTLISMLVIALTGTPLAWWLASSPSRLVRPVEVLVDLPIVIPPAVVGVALLQTFGRQGLLGPILERFGVFVPFTQVAVVLAQVVVAAPFFVHAAANAFKKIDQDMLIVARTLGASPLSTFFRVAVPIALPGLVVGVSLAWARSLGEFGATLLFAGNMTGTTQTMPLAIFTALESDVRVAVAFSLVLAAMGAVLLLSVRVAPTLLGSRSPTARTSSGSP